MRYQQAGRTTCTRCLVAIFCKSLMISVMLLSSQRKENKLTMLCICVHLQLVYKNTY